jgi:hypothetical protein
MKLVDSKTCLVYRCKRPVERLWWTDMAGGHELPVCSFHYWRRLWWYRGCVFDRDEEAE